MRSFYILLFLISTVLISNSLASAQTNEASPSGRPESGTARFMLIGGKALLGQVTGVVEKTVSLVQQNGSSVDLTVTEVTKFSRAGRKIRLADVKEGDRILALGALSTDGTFLTKSVIVKARVLKVLEKQVVFGSVSEVGVNSFSLVNVREPNLSEVAVTSQTLFRKNKRKTSFEKLESGQKVIAVVLKEENGDLTARLVVTLSEPKTTPAPEASPAAQPENPGN